uniref:Uncharacterized protein n=1 Tax=Vespula pensylvanica TaxID=30213 RepID=A0A834PA62_VESPE|nr:hypothetical protein H0235_002482 [Vespula pensylvanica]
MSDDNDNDNDHSNDDGVGDGVGDGDDDGDGDGDDYDDDGDENERRNNYRKVARASRMGQLAAGDQRFAVIISGESIRVQTRTGCTCIYTECIRENWRLAIARSSASTAATTVDDLRVSNSS